MQERQIIKAFRQHNISLSPQANTYIQLNCAAYLDNLQLNRFIEYARDLHTDIISEEQAIYVWRMLNGLEQKQADSLIDKLNQRIKSSLIILSPFEDNKSQVFMDVNAKIQMFIKRLDHVISILKLDNDNYAFGLYDEKKVNISQIGSVIGNVGRANIIGLLTLIGGKQVISDGTFMLSVDIAHCNIGNIIDMHQPVGIVNQGSVVIATGEWNEQESIFDVYQLSNPYFRIDKSQYTQGDIINQLSLDKFGLLKRMHIIKDPIDTPLDRQKIIDIYPIKQSNFIICLSNFNLDNLVTIQKFDALLRGCDDHKLIPSILLLIGPFGKGIYRKEFLSLISQYPLQNCLIFFMASFDDFPQSHSMPHVPIDLYLLLETPTPTMQAISNPSRIGICGIKLIAIRIDVSQEIRKQNIKQDETKEQQVCETIIAQQYLGSFKSNRIAYKWDDSLILDPTIEYVILADQSLIQFKYQTITNPTMFINPGNFSDKGQFCTLNHRKGKLDIETCKI